MKFRTGLGTKPSEMTWFRTKLKHGATLALMALAINLTLAFGHCHVDGMRSHQAASVLPGSGGTADDSVPINTNDDDACAICKTIAAMGTALAPTLPSLPVVLKYARLDLAPVSETAVRQ